MTSIKLNVLLAKTDHLADVFKKHIQDNDCCYWFESNSPDNGSIVQRIGQKFSKLLI